MGQEVKAGVSYFAISVAFGDFLVLNNPSGGGPHSTTYSARGRLIG